MYAVASEIQPDSYRYTVTSQYGGSWELCSDARWDVGAGLIGMGAIDGVG
jgi:hypothetical protein